MSRRRANNTLRRAQVSFTAGALSPRIKGRTDTAIFYLGCETLRNALVRAEGSAWVRPGMRTVLLAQSAPGKAAARLASFSYNATQRYLVSFTDGKIRVIDAATDEQVANLDAPYLAGGDLSELDYIQIADTMLIVHPLYPMQALERGPLGHFGLTPWVFERPPCYRHAAASITLQASATTGPAVTMTASAATFAVSDIGSIWKMAGNAFRITAFTDPTHVTVAVLDTLHGTTATPFWAEQAASVKRGYFGSIAYFQDRLWLGGTAQAPTQIWASRVGAPYDFLTGGVTAADPLEFSMSTGQIEPIRFLVPGAGGLEVYSTGGEGIVPGGIDAPVTTATVSYVAQSAFGAKPVKPVRLNSSTIFAQTRSGNIREMIYSDSERSYSPVPLTVRAANLVPDPVRMAAVPGGFGSASDYLVIINRDGTGAIMTSERSQEVSAWSQFVSARQLLDVCAVGSKVYVATRGAGSDVWLEHMDQTYRFDSQSSASVSVAKRIWLELAPQLASSTAEVWADGYWLGELPVGPDGGITLENPARTVEVGLPIDFRIRPMPVSIEGDSLLGRTVRPIKCELRYYLSAGIRVAGTDGVPRQIGDRDFNFATTTAPQRRSAIARVTLSGWSKGEVAPIELSREGPFPVEILALAVDYAVGNR